MLLAVVSPHPTPSLLGFASLPRGRQMCEPITKTKTKILFASCLVSAGAKPAQPSPRHPQRSSVRADSEAMAHRL